MEAKFTKGEWVIKETAPITCAWTFDFEKMNLGFSIEADEFNANIKLMQVAPKMYDMLEDAMCLLAEQNDKECKSLSKDIRNLRKEARGELK